jgi:hypothetical protein
MIRTKLFLTLVALLVASSPAMADDLSGSNRFLCSAALVTGCSADGECESGAPWDLNVPRFIEIDLDKKELRTTKASHENRKTSIKNIEREDGMIILQGYEGGRAFSFMIEKKTGMLTAAVARGNLGVVVFGSCTPLPSSK